MGIMFEIEDGPPDIAVSAKIDWQSALNKMNVGQSFVIQHEHVDSAKVVTSRRKKKGETYMVRKAPIGNDGEYAYDEDGKKLYRGPYRITRTK